MTSRANRVFEKSQSTGLGNLKLNGAENGYYSFFASFGTGVTFGYTIENPITGENECGFGEVVTSGGDYYLQRNSVERSSNANAKVNFAAGFKYIQNVLLASEADIVADPTVAGLAALTSTPGVVVQTAADTFTTRTMAVSGAGLSLTNPAGTAGNPTLALADDAAALEALSSTGIAVRTASNTWAQRTLQAPAAGMTITNPAGVAGDPTLAFANDLAALEALSSTGIAVRTASDAWAQRSIATANAGRITVTDGDGVAGNPTLDLATVISAAGPIGAAGTVPIVTVDAYGRVTALSSTAITGEALTLSDVTTNNVSTSKHGFHPKLDNTATHFMDMTGSQRALAASDLGTTMTPQFSYIGLNDTPNSQYKLLATDATLAARGRFLTGSATGTAAIQLGYGSTSSPTQEYQIAARGDFGGFNFVDMTASASRMFIAATSGLVGFGNVTTLLAKVESRYTSGAQFAASYDGSNYATLTVDSTGVLTVGTTGSAAGFTFSSNGLVLGSGAGRGKVQSTLKTVSTTSANSGSGETDLHSATILANTLATNGDAIEVIMCFGTAANANNKTIKVKFGSTTIYDTTALAANNSDVIIWAQIMRTGATTQVSFAALSAKNGSAFTQPNVTRGAPAETLSGSVTLKATGQGTSTNDVTQYMTIVNYIPANT